MIMKNAFSTVVSVITVTVALAATVTVSAQVEAESVRKVNFVYSQNPKTKTKNKEIEGNKAEVTAPDQREITTGENEIVGSSGTSEVSPIENKEFESRSAASKTLEVVKRANLNAALPTEIYKVGIGDVLFISLQNAPTKASNYFTVLNDGTIDYPLAGEMVAVGGLLTDEIEELIRTKVKLYENPQVSVRVREHASHAVTVLGLVEKAGIKYLPREAVPMFLIRAEAVVQSKADWLVIKRASSMIEQIDLKDAKSEDVLIFPGDILEFKLKEAAVENNFAGSGFYYIGGNISSAGQKNFHAGLTLTQAILASGGLKKQNVKKVIIRRTNQEGLLSSIEYNLTLIKNGKQPDPQIRAGDTIEVVN